MKHELEIALRHIAELETRAAFADAGAKSSLYRVVAPRVSAHIEQGNIRVRATLPDGTGEMSLTELVEELRADVPNAFVDSDARRPAAKAKAMPQIDPNVMTFNLEAWTRKLGTVSAVERRELMRRAGAGEIRVTSQ